MTRLPVLMALSLLATTLPAGAADPPLVSALPCVLPEQVDDALLNLDHLLDDLGGLASAPVALVDLEPASSPHLRRLTVPGDLVVANPLVVANLHLVVCGDVLVLPTGSLTLYGATLTVAHPARDGLLRVMGLEVPTDRLPAVETGSLRLAPLERVHEDELLGGAASRLLFTHPDAPAVVEGTALRPVRVLLEPGTVLRAEDALVRATTGIEATGAALVAWEGGAIDSTGQGLYLFNVAHARVRDASVRASTEAFYVTTSQDARFERLVVEGTTGIHLANARDVRVVDTRITASRDGLYAFNSDGLLLHGLDVAAASGVYAASSQDVVVQHGRIVARGTGITLTDTRDATLAWNDLQGAQGKGIRGVYLERTQDVRVEGNRIAGAGIGLHLLTGEGTFAACNTLSGNVRGAYVSTTVDAVFRGNALHNNSMLDLHAFLSPGLDARDNWWGSTVQAEVRDGLFEGTASSILADPWLAAAPACPAPVTDLTPPQVRITRPEPGTLYLNDGPVRISLGGKPLVRAVVGLGPLTVHAEASDAGGVAKVRFAVDGVVLAEDAQAPFQFRWDPPLGAAGWRTFQATAVDHAGNEATDEALVLLHVGL